MGVPLAGPQHNEARNITSRKARIFIEVKQSGLYLKAKSWADIEDVRRDLNQTIASGVKQLLSFEEGVQSRKYPELGKLANTLEIERLIVTYDRSYYVNSILRDMVKKILVEQNYIVPEDYHWHTISVEELEYALGIHGTRFFDFLKLKRLEPSSDMMDFRDYLDRTSSESEFSNSYLIAGIARLDRRHHVQHPFLQFRPQVVRNINAACC